MTYLHLFWASLAIPVIIHLVYRRKARRIPFSTLRFVQMVDQRVARRHRLKELLLLALRVLLLAALIGALYRPIVRSETFRGENVPAAAAIVLDNTYSMRAVHEGMARFDRATGAAAEILSGLQHGDSASLVLFDDPDDAPVEFTTGLSSLIARLDSIECGYGTAPAAGALGRALKGLAQSRQPEKELYVISDFQRLSWTPAVRELSNLNPDMPVYLIDAGGPMGENLSLETAEFGLNVQVAGAASEVLCTVANTGPENMNKKLTLAVNGEKTAEEQVALAPGARMGAVLRHVFGRTGDVGLEARLEPDALLADNARYIAAKVREELPVLLVNGDPSAAAFLDETTYARLALEAPAPGGTALSPLQVQTVTTAELPRVGLADYACVLLANVPRFSEQAAAALGRYVRDGGGLIVFLGDRVDVASYNTALGADLLPGVLGRAQEDPEGASLSHINRTHPVFYSLAEHINAGRVRVERSISVEPTEDAAVLAATAMGPLLLEKNAGAGIVLLCATAADMDWSNLPARPFYLPLLHQMVYYSGRPAERAADVTVGMPYVLRLPRTDDGPEVSFYGPGDDEEPLAVLKPEGGEQPQIVFPNTALPGIYRAVYSLEGEQQRRLFAVNVDAAESQFDRVAPEEVAEMLQTGQARVVSEPKNLGQIVQRRRRGLPLWNYLFAAAIVLAVAESYVGNALIKR